MMTDNSPVMIHDAVNHPSHYRQGAVECIDAIKSALGDEGFQSYCTGNVLKYLFRWQHKNGLEDLQKAQWYLTELIKQFGA
jgi:hypothetical protein